MNLGQFLTAKSPLPSGTVAQHLAAIAASVGTGTGETVFASQFSVQADTPSLVVKRRGTRSVQGETQGETQDVTPQVRQSKSQKNVVVFSTVPSAVAFTVLDEITVLQRTKSVVATTRFTSETIARKRQSGLVESV